MAKYKPFSPILDRCLIKYLPDESGDRDGFEVPEKYRQQTGKGEILAVGNFCVLSGHKFPITDIVNVGDLVMFGQYTQEEFSSDELFKQFGLTENDRLFIVRVQDIRGHAARENE